MDGEGGPDSRNNDAGWACRTCGNEGAGEQCTVCRGGLDDRPVLSQTGCSAWAIAKGAKQSVGRWGAGVSAIEIGCGKGWAMQSSGACREADLGVGEAMEKFVGWSGGCGRPGWGGPIWQETNYLDKLPRPDILGVSMGRYDAPWHVVVGVLCYSTFRCITRRLLSAMLHHLFQLRRRSTCFLAYILTW